MLFRSVAWVGLVAVVASALSVVYQTALYRYAETGAVPAAFSSVDLHGAFRPKRGGHLTR